MSTSAPARVARAIAALVVLVALVAGVPWLLTTFGGNPLPGHIPSWDEIGAFLGGNDIAGGFVSFLLIVAWLAWAYLVIAIVLAIPAELRHRPALSLPGGGGTQRLAGLLVGAILAIFIAGATAPPVNAAPAAPQAQVTAPQSPTTPAEVTTPAAPAPAAANLVITVQHGQTLWGLAATYFGDGLRYTEIADANNLPHNTLLDVGMKLQIPGITAPTATTNAATEHIVQSGENITTIATEYYGTTDAVDEVIEANVGKVQTDGSVLTDPDLIHVGWSIELPALNQTTGPVSAQPPAPQPSPVPQPPPAAETPQPPEPAPTTAPTAQAPAAPTAVAPTAPSPASSTAAATPTAQAANTDPTVQTSTAIGALLAGSVLGLLGTRRLIQSRRRRPGHQVPLPQMSSLELAMRTIEEPATIGLLDRALRSVAAQAASQTRTVPAITAAIVSSSTVRLLPAHPTDPIEPFTATSNDWWELDRRSSALLDVAIANDYAAPCPTLVTLGTSAEGELYLIDLESAGAVSLLGSSEVVLGILCAVAIELAAAPWADDITVHTVGFATDLAHVIDGDRLSATAELDEVLDELEHRQQLAIDALDGEQVQDARNARASGNAAASWSADIVLSTSSINPDQRRRLALIADDRRSPLAAVICISEPDQALPGPWQLNVNEYGQAHVQPIDATVVMQRLTASQRATLIRDLVAATDESTVMCRDVPAEPTDLLPELPPSSMSEPVPDIDAQPADIADIETLGPEIRVLGPIEITGATGPVDQNKRTTLLELAAYLALNPGTSGDTVSEVLGAERPWAANTRNSNVSRLRKWLGKDAAGNDFVAIMGMDDYRLGDAVRTDWQRFNRYLERGLATQSTDDLERALRLVRGAPFSGRQRKRYVWADRLGTQMREAIVDAAHALASAYTVQGRVADARRAIDTGLLAEPSSELLYRDLMRAEHRVGNLAGVQDAEDRLDVINDELGLARENDTDQLLQELYATQRASG